MLGQLFFDEHVTGDTSPCWETSQYPNLKGSVKEFWSGFNRMVLLPILPWCLEIGWMTELEDIYMWSDLLVHQNLALLKYAKEKVYLMKFTDATHLMEWIYKGWVCSYWWQCGNIALSCHKSCKWKPCWRCYLLIFNWIKCCWKFYIYFLKVYILPECPDFMDLL